MAFFTKLFSCCYNETVCLCAVGSELTLKASRRLFKSQTQRAAYSRCPLRFKRRQHFSFPDASSYNEPRLLLIASSKATLSSGCFSGFLPAAAAGRAAAWRPSVPSSPWTPGAGASGRTWASQRPWPPRCRRPPSG